MNEEFNFVSYEVALIASQTMAFHYAQLGFHVTWGAYKGNWSSKVSVNIFHDELTIINPPKGYVYSRKWEGSTDDTYWTTIEYLTEE